MADKFGPDNMSLGKGLAYGLEVAIGAGLGYLIGAWLDRRFGVAPWGTVIGVFVGLAAGMYSMVKEAVRSDPPKKSGPKP